MSTTLTDPTTRTLEYGQKGEPDAFAATLRGCSDRAERRFSRIRRAVSRS